MTPSEALSTICADESRWLSAHDGGTNEDRGRAWDRFHGAHVLALRIADLDELDRVIEVGQRWGAFMIETGE